MNKLSEVVLKPLKDSSYVKPQSFECLQNGKRCQRDFLIAHDGVAVVLYNISRKVLLFVKQFRPLAYFGSIPPEDRKGEISVEKYPAELGITIELCVGIVNKQLSLENITAERIYQKCGYKIDVKSLEKVSSYRSGTGRTGSIQTLFYCEITDQMKVSEGGSVGDEFNLVEMTVPEMKALITKDHVLSPASFLFAMYWFLANKV